MTWAELEQVAASAIASELGATMPRTMTERVAKRIVEDVKIEFLKSEGGDEEFIEPEGDRPRPTISGDDVTFPCGCKGRMMPVEMVSQCDAHKGDILLATRMASTIGMYQDLIHSEPFFETLKRRGR